MPTSDPLDGAKVSTGIPGMDELLEGGLRPGGVYIVEGPPGAGKTVFANQFCYATAARGESSVYVTLLAETHDRMLRHLDGMSFFRREEVNRRVFYASAFDALSTSGLDAVLRTITAIARERKARVLVLDGVFVLENGPEEDARFRAFLNSLATLAHMLGMVVVLLTSPTRKPTMPERTMVDGWIELDHCHLEYRTYRQVEVRKYRGSGFVPGRHKMTITSDGIRVWPRLEAVKGHGAEPPVPTRRLTTGVEGLDALLQGGLGERTTTVVHGPMGVGKTTFGMAFVAAGDDPAVMVSFLEREQALRARAEALRIPFGPRRDAGTLDFVWMQPSELILDQVAYGILDVVQRRGARRVFVDGVDLLAESVVHPRRLGSYFLALSTELRSLGATAVVSIRDAGRGGLDATMLDALAAAASNVIGLHFVPVGDEPTRVLRLGKVRDSAFDAHVHPFHIDGGGLVVGGRLPAEAASPVLGGEHG